MSLFSLSLAVNLMRCSQFSFSVGEVASDKLANNYHLLREAICDSPEYGDIHSFLD